MHVKKIYESVNLNASCCLPHIALAQALISWGVCVRDQIEKVRALTLCVNEATRDWPNGLVVFKALG